MNAVSTGQNDNMNCCPENIELSTDNKKIVSEEELLRRPYITPEDVLQLDHITESEYNVH